MILAVRRLVCVSANPAIDKTVAVDVLRSGEIHRPVILAMLPGGKALNVARAASRLGLDVCAVAITAGHAGRWFEDALTMRSIRGRFVRINGETRTCTSILDRSTGRLTELYEAGPPLPPDTWRELEAVLAEELTAGADPERTLVVASGSLPPGAPEDGFGRLAAVGAAHDARIAVDTGQLGLARALPARPWLVKVNAAEAGAATGVPTSDEGGAVAAARALRVAGATIALVTRGTAGAVLVTDEGAWRIGPPPERGPYTVGSGDALVAGFARALADGHPLPEAARRGAATAAANALGPGQGELDPADAARLLPGITLERLED